MQRNVYLQGDMGDIFTPHLTVDCDSVREVLCCLDANFSNFKQYLIEKHEQNIGFEVDIAGEKLEYGEELLMNITEGDITITPLPMGSKSGPAKIILAAVMIYVAFNFPGLYTSPEAAAAANAVEAGSAVAGFTKIGGALAAMGANLALTGLQQMMAPDPSTDADQEESYLFNGAEQNIIEGDPVPVLYGRLRVPGQVISFEVGGVNHSRNWFNGVTDGSGNTAHGGLSAAGFFPGGGGKAGGGAGGGLRSGK